MHPSQQPPSKAAAHNPERRRFMTTIGLGAAAAGAAAAAGHITHVQADTAPVENEKPTTNYRETDHIRAYYASLRD